MYMCVRKTLGVACVHVCGSQAKESISFSDVYWEKLPRFASQLYGHSEITGHSVHNKKACIIQIKEFNNHKIDHK